MIFFLSAPYLFYILFAFMETPPWFVLQSRTTVVTISSLFLALQILFHFQSEKISSFLKDRIVWGKSLPYLLAAYFLFSLLFPLQNMNWGDGLILLENSFLDVKLFGFQVALDEVGSTVFNSLFSRTLPMFGEEIDAKLSYQLVSYLCGIVFLLGIGWYLPSEKRENRELSGILLFLVSGGSLLFFGYAENYAILTLLVLFFLIWTRKAILADKQPIYILLGATLWVSVCILFHIVSGYLAFVLLYLWLRFSPKEEKLRHLLYCSLAGFSVLVLGFSYFLFFSDPTIDRQSSHILHPPFYPWKRMISIGHAKDFFSVLWWNCFLPAYFCLAVFLYQKDKWKQILSLPENRIFLFSILGFTLHAFTMNPLLGFPGDWDIMGVYWTSFALLGWVFWKEVPSLAFRFLPLLVFTGILFVWNAQTLSIVPEDDESERVFTKELVVAYSELNGKKIDSLPKGDKKFFSKMDFFFFKAYLVTERICPFSEKEQILSELKSLREEFQSAYDRKLAKDKTWYKDFITRATETNTKYVKSLKANKLCHHRL